MLTLHALTHRDTGDESDYQPEPQVVPISRPRLVGKDCACITGSPCEAHRLKSLRDAGRDEFPNPPRAA